MSCCVCFCKRYPSFITLVGKYTHTHASHSIHILYVCCAVSGHPKLKSHHHPCVRDTFLSQISNQPKCFYAWFSESHTQTYTQQVSPETHTLYRGAYALCDTFVAQMSGDVEHAAELYARVTRQDPRFNPYVAAAYHSHLIWSHPWAAGMYGEIRSIQSRGCASRTCALSSAASYHDCTSITCSCRFSNI